MTSREQLYKYCGNQCAHCGKSVDEMVQRYGTFNRMFQFHHVAPETKHYDYDNLIRNNISSKQIEEIDKCVLLCTECHGIIHAQNIEVTIKVETLLANRSVSQEMKGWFSVDNVDKIISFVTNDRLLLQPCVVKLGCDKESMYCILELAQESRLYGWLTNIEIHKNISIWSENMDKLLLHVQHESGRRANVMMSLGFPLLAMDFKVDEGNSKYLWLRNGMVLTKEGKVLTHGEIRFPLNLSV